LFSTLARHRRLFRRWLAFAGALMPRGTLARTETELVILRVAHNCDCEYELRQHEAIAEAAGLSPAEVARTAQGPAAGGWEARQTMLLRAADELHGQRTLGHETWSELRPLFSDTELIELCMLVGHYEMLAMTLNGLAVVPEEQQVGGGRAALLARLRQRRGS
jgi:AhpD family alkylhydroperoxidase